MIGVALILGVVVGSVGATHASIDHCDKFTSHVRCAGKLDVMSDDDKPMTCVFLARLYPRGMRKGDARDFVDLAIVRCKSTTKLAMLDRQMGASRRVGVH